MSSPRRILIIDDEPSLVFMLTDRLEAEGYRVDAERDGEAGLTRASSQPFDVIILDGMLPASALARIDPGLLAKSGPP